MKLIITPMLALSIAHLAIAQPNSQVASGIGTYSCGRYIELRQQNDPMAQVMLTSWMQGFLSGMNWTLAASNQMKLLPDHQSLNSYLDKYCRDNPLQQIISGVSALHRELPADGKKL